MSIRIVPTEGRVLLRAPTEPEKVGSLYVPQSASASQELVQAEVVAVGRRALKDERLQEMRAGDIILIHRMSGIHLKYDGQDYRLAQQGEVFALLREEQLANEEVVE